MTRKRRTAGQWREVLLAYEASGLSGLAYCQANGIGEKSFYRARSKYGSGKRMSSTGFVRVTAAQASSDIALVLPCGTIRMGAGISPVWVADLVKSLSS